MTVDGVEAVRYSVDHCWARLGVDGNVTVGLTDFAQSALGAIVFAGLPAVGSEIAADEVLGEVESTKAVSELYAPVGGAIVEVNGELVSNPGEINADPYGAGWICTIEPTDASAFARLLDEASYAKMIDVISESEPSTKD